MKLSASAQALIRKYEGCKLAPYLCPAGVPTIGIGTTIYPDGKRVSLKDKAITKEQAEEFFQKDLEVRVKAVRALLSQEVDEGKLGALVSFAYNLGIGALGRSSLLKYVNAGEFTRAADEFLKWIHSKGVVEPGLVSRRKAERDMFLGPN